MNGVDLVLAALLLLFALRGYWRGFFRESFGLLALFGGLAAAMRFAPAAAIMLEPYLTVSAVREGVSFVGVFVVTYAVTNLIGALLHRLAGAAGRSGSNRVAGAVVGAGKGGALLALLLLFVHLFPLAPELEKRLAESRLAPPLVQGASTVIRFGSGIPALPGDSELA